MSLLDDTVFDKLTSEYLIEIGFKKFIENVNGGLYIIYFNKPNHTSWSRMCLSLHYYKSNKLIVEVSCEDTIFHTTTIEYKRILQNPDKSDLNLILNEIDSKFNYKQSIIMDSDYMFIC